ncbi:TPA: cytosine permease, partial [Salmonella enterica subsp. enterica serovar Muenchen]|nr:cytosine permease [Salmonella enterica subsp. enterica serovar Muenchen]
TAGIVTIAVLSLYSASLNLLSMGIHLRQRTAITVDAILITAIALYVLFVSKDFLGPFISFLIFCGVFLSAWSAIFIIDFWRYRFNNGYQKKLLFDDSGYNKKALLCWLLGSLSGLMVTKTGFIDGPFATGIFADSSLGLFVSFFLSLILYIMFNPQKGNKHV